MAKETASYPLKIWDGLSRNSQRVFLLDEIEPNPEDWNKLVSEVIQMQTHSGTGPIVSVVDGPTIIFDVSENKKQEVILGGNRTLVVTGEKVGDTFMLRIVQDGTGARTVTWFSGISWPGGVDPTLTVSADAADAFVILVRAVGVYDGYILGQDL